MAKKPKFTPYNVKCPGCRTDHKVKSADMIGTRISCTKCNRKIDVMSPEEEGSIPYELGGAVEKMKPRGPTQEELDELAEKEERERRWANWVMFKHITSIILLLIGISIVGYLLYRGYEKFQRDQLEQQKAENKNNR